MEFFTVKDKLPDDGVWVLARATIWNMAGTSAIVTLISAKFHRKTGWALLDNFVKVGSSIEVDYWTWNPIYTDVYKDLDKKFK